MDAYSVSNMEPLPVPFDVSLTPENLHADDAPNQDVALDAAMCAPTAFLDHDDSYSDARVLTKTLGYMKRVYDTCNTTVALELLQRRVQIDMSNAEFITSPDNKDLAWNPDNHYINLMICVPRGLGLGALLPNRLRMHTFEFTLDMEQPHRTFSSKYAKLGFDPTAAMLWIGRSPSSEDVWLAWAPTESLQIDCEDVKPRKCTGSTNLSVKHHRMTTMFMASMLQAISHRDLIVSDPYPDLDDKVMVHFATNVL
jgi:hypothetical protein